ncbi:hypothetical protein [Nonomuraea wenchangensis]|uniref:hypothetical protein n=1 Tax=Nonomuraea wenchangensis TaxID=568860 RepID=UPI00331C86E5
MNTYDADERVARFILKTYREPGEAENAHLRDCPDATVQDPDAYDGTYGCDTGCDYARFEGVITCPHGEREQFEWGDFGEIGGILDEMEQDERAASESAGR